MTREDADALIAWFGAADAPGEGNAVMIGIKKTQVADLVRLARLGAKVIAPTEDEVKVAIDAWFSPALRAGPTPAEFIKRMRAALSALQEPQP